MGAYIFPLLIKVLLAKKGRYKLSEEEECKIFTTDALLDLPLYYDKEKRKSLWVQTISDKRCDYRWR
jgi:hypothetical protein